MPRADVPHADMKVAHLWRPFRGRIPFATFISVLVAARPPCRTPDADRTRG
jgi:hypothetical protein